MEIRCDPLKRRLLCQGDVAVLAGCRQRKGEGKKQLAELRRRIEKKKFYKRTTEK